MQKAIFLLMTLLLARISYGQEEALSYIIKGNQKLELGDNGGAIVDFTRAIKLDPKSANIKLAYYFEGMQKLI